MIWTQEIVGGALIGLGSALPLLWNSRVAGVSGYAAAAIRPTSGPAASTALAFIVGIIMGAPLLLWASGKPTDFHLSGPFWTWATTGILVGFGSRLAGGCTSGHGVCGMGRLSKRSFLAVAIFMATAILTQSVLGVLL